MVEFVIRGGYGLRNFGDDALMYYLVNALRLKYPDCGIHLDCNNAEYIKKIVDVDFCMDKFSCDPILIYGGGTLYYSFPSQSRGVLMKLIKGLKNPYLLLRWFKIRFSTKNKDVIYKKKIMLGLGFGPFHSVRHKNYFEAIRKLKSMDVVIVRDSVSYNFSKQHTSNVILGTDICYSTSMKHKEYKNNHKKVEKIAVVLRDWNSGACEDGYIPKVYEGVSALRELGFQVDFVIFSDLADKEVASFLKKKDEKPLFWNPDCLSVDEFMVLLSGYSLIISSRFHGVIFSSLMNVPSIGIEIEPKISLAKENAIVEVWHPVQNSIKELVDVVEQISLAYPDYVNKCSKMTKEKSFVFDEMLDLIDQNC